jgi:8-oxo-dGTP pyrophosphatase MutT (NUDIX family)
MEKHADNKYDHLIWQEEGRRDVFKCRPFSVHESICRSPEGGDVGTFTVIDAEDCAVVVPVIETEHGKAFVMVRQWRHGSRELSLEFPGGVFEHGENGERAAGRELEEETAYAARKITKLGEMSPNPAIMSNHVHFFVAEDLYRLPSQRLDEDEYVEAEIIPVDEVVRGMGRAPYTHALMASALLFYLREHKGYR